MTIRTVIEHAGTVTVTDDSGVRVFNQQGEEITRYDGDAQFHFRMAQKHLDLAFIRQAQEQK